ncbi:MAG: conjugal transfer protein TraU, partial [Sphingomonas sp.]
MKRFLLITCLLLSAMLAKPVMAAGSNAGDGRWVNP